MIDASTDFTPLSLAYAITIHKSQGSEFPVVVIPLATQHYLLLLRNLVYTGITRGKKMVVWGVSLLSASQIGTAPHAR